MVDSKTLARAEGKHLQIREALIEHDKDGDGICDPALRWIVKVTGLSLAVVGREIKKMAALGYLKIEARGRESRLYRLSPGFFGMRGPRGSRDDRQGDRAGAPVDVAARRDESPSGGTQRPAAGTQSPSSGTEEERNSSEYELSTKTIAARARPTRPPEGRKHLDRDSLARQARPGAGSQQREMLMPIAGGAGDRDPTGVKKLKRDRWLGSLSEYANHRYANDPERLARIWLLLTLPADEARTELNALDAEMRGSSWWRERQAAIARANGGRR